MNFPLLALDGVGILLQCFASDFSVKLYTMRIGTSLTICIVIHTYTYINMFICICRCICICRWVTSKKNSSIHIY